MKRRTKYVGLDVHQATTVASVREEGGRVIARSIVPTEETTIGRALRSPYPCPLHNTTYRDPLAERAVEIAIHPHMA
jgi:hypothetical protein